MTIKQLDHLNIYICAVSGALSIQKDALENENLAQAKKANRDMIQQINKCKHLIDALHS